MWLSRLACALERVEVKVRASGFRSRLAHAHERVEVQFRATRSRGAVQVGVRRAGQSAAAGSIASRVLHWRHDLRDSRFARLWCRGDDGAARRSALASGEARNADAQNQVQKTRAPQSLQNRQQKPTKTLGCAQKLSRNHSPKTENQNTNLFKSTNEQIESCKTNAHTAIHT